MRVCGDLRSILTGACVAPSSTRKATSIAERSLLCCEALAGFDFSIFAFFIEVERVMRDVRSYGYRCRCFLLLLLGCVVASASIANAQSSTPAAQPAGGQPAAAVPPPSPPFPNRANELMPSWLRVRGEFRERVEGFAGSGFVEGRDDLYALSRFRFNATVTPSTMFAFQVQAQDARVAKKQVGPTLAPFKGAFDLRMAFADVGNAKTPVAVRLGRQELAYGEQRLVGHVSWLNTARTFDGAKVTLRGKKASVDVFGASVVRILDKEFDKSGNGNKFFGAYATTAVLPKSSLEPYFFWRGDRAITQETGGAAHLGVATIGARWAGALPARLDYSVEMAAQTGTVGTDDVRAWAGHWTLRETYPGPHALKLSAELNMASGDSNPTDGTRGTFDQLYPTPHDKYGLSDQVGWRNIRHVRAGVDITPWKKWTLGGNYHSWWLMESRDGLYNAGGTQIARVIAGATSTHVGQELDAQVTRPITPQLLLAGGVAHIFPGGFLKQATPGASYTFPYVMATYVFLADK